MSFALAFAAMAYAISVACTTLSLILKALRPAEPGAPVMRQVTEVGYFAKNSILFTVTKVEAPDEATEPLPAQGAHRIVRQRQLELQPGVSPWYRAAALGAALLGLAVAGMVAALARAEHGRAESAGWTESAPFTEWAALLALGHFLLWPVLEHALDERLRSPLQPGLRFEEPL